MRTIILLALIGMISAADAPPTQLDPTKPADAVQIVDMLTRQATLPRDQAVALTVAIDTLRKLASDKPAVPVKESK